MSACCAVLVEVGDVVHEGDLLAELDGEPIEDQLATQKASLETASGSAGAQVQRKTCGLAAEIPPLGNRPRGSRVWCSSPPVE